jgi:betaine/carnitine transporter, BCCT family
MSDSNDESDTVTSEALPAPEGASEIIDTEYEIGEQNITPQIGPFGLDIHNPVFVISGLVVVAFVILTLAFQTQVEPMFTALRGFLTSNFDWFFLIAGNIFVLVCLGSSSRRWARSASAAPTRRPTTVIPAGSRCCSPPAWASA